MILVVALCLGLMPASAFAAGGTVNGKVTDAATRAVIVGAKITVSGAGGTYYATTGSTGTYTVSGIPAGAYSVKCDASGYASASGNVTVVEGRSVRLDFKLTKAVIMLGNVTGTVKSAAGVALSGAKVTNADGSFSVTADSTGKYTISNLPVDSYVLVASATGYSAASKTVVVTAGQTTIADFSLETAKPIVRYERTHVFSIDDVQGDYAATKFGTAALDMNNPVVGADGLTYYNIDSDFGFDAVDYVGFTERPMDGVYAEGSVANVKDSKGNTIGIKGKTSSPAQWKVATALTGEWYKDPASGEVIKACTEHYLVMEHWLNAPGAPALVYGTDYRARFKDDGKKLYMWGDMNSEPTDIRLYAKMALPDAWKTAGADYKVTSAKLVITHLIAESPNDQVRPEDIENENATGILPQYAVQSDGTWTSAVDAYDGCNHFLPAGTLMRMAQPILVPNVDEFGKPLKDYWGNLVTEPDVVWNTAAWYTTKDRDPFAGANPRWRLKAGIFGQDLPGISIPQYKVGDYTTVTLDLLAPMTDEETGLKVPSALTSSVNWKAYMDDGDGVIDGKSINGTPLTADFDLSQYIKGTTQGQVIYNAKLIVDYEDAGGTVPSGVDAAIASLAVPAQVKLSTANAVTVDVKNNVPGIANGTLKLTGTDLKGKVYPFEVAFVTKSDCSATRYTFNWQAPGYGTTVTWTAELVCAGDTDLSNNTATAKTKVVK